MFSISPASLSLKPHMKKNASRFSFVSNWKCAVPLFLFLHSICIPILDVCRSFAAVRTQAIQSILWGNSWFRVLSPGWWVSPWEVQLLQSVNFPGLRLELHVFALTVSSRQAKDAQKTSRKIRYAKRERERVRNPSRLHVASPFFVHMQKAEKPSFLPW